MMENLESAEKLETGKSELEHESELYDKLKKLEDKEWIYQDYINTMVQKAEEKHDQIRKKVIEAEKRAEQAISEKDVFAEENKDLKKRNSDLMRNVTQHSMTAEALAAAKCKIDELNGKLAANEMKIKDSQLAMEAIRREKEGLFQDLEAAKSQLQIKEKELQEPQRKNEDISKEKHRHTEELDANESHVEMEAIRHEKEGLFKELEATKSQLQIKEKELQELQRKKEDISEESEVALSENDMVQSMLDTIQSQENEPKHIVPSLRNRRKKQKKKMKRATDAHPNPRIASATSSSIKWVLRAAAVLVVFIVGIFLLCTRYYTS